MGRRTVVASSGAALRITILSFGATHGLFLSMLDPNVKLITVKLWSSFIYSQTLAFGSQIFGSHY